MPDILSSLADAYTNVSPGFVETLLQSRREELFTGLMRLHHPTGETFIFTFLDGQQQKLYRCLEKSTEVIPRRSWSVALDLPNASVSFVTLSVECLRLMHIAHDAPVTRIEGQTCTLEQLKGLVKTWSGEPESSTLHIHAGPFDHVFLLSGVDNPVIEGLSITNGASSFSLNDSSFPAQLHGQEFQVTRYVSDREHSTWQEYELRHACNPLMRLLLGRFSELAGRMLTDRLCEQISLWLKNEGWNIKVSVNGVANRHYFESLEETAAAYLGMLRCFQEEAGAAIGPRMAEALSHEIVPKLDAHRREILLRYIYDTNQNYAVTGWLRRQAL